MFGSIQHTGHEAIGTTDPQVDLADDQRRAMTTVPAHQMLGLGPCVEYAPARRSEHAREHEFPVGRHRHHESVVIACPYVHAYSPSLAVPADRRPDDRVSLPRAGGIARASRRPRAARPAGYGMDATAPRGRG